MISTDDLVTHMRGVHAAERDLRDLGVVWRMVESSAAISCPDEVAPILPTLENTRVRFDELRQRLVDQMVLENQAELADELSAKAQCAIDILVRNLYERTADVGFLSTDDMVRSYCAEAQRGEAERSAMVARLSAYQAKYTVYDDIILLSPEGAVLARLDTGATLSASADPVVAAALAAPGYVERFGCSDLAANAAPALLYAHRIDDGNRHGRPLGVLVLRFRFADEMRRIFDSINADNLQLALVLVDEQQRVVASNDEAHVPIGALLGPVDGSAIALTAFAGREYLAVRRASPGYQGYAGPAWRAQAMVSLLTAFRQRGNEDPVGEVVPLDNAELVAMNRNADAINRDLRRVVWNGRLMAGNDATDRDGLGANDNRGRLKAVLKQVNQTGMRTRQRVAQAIQDIHRTSLARARRQTRELARLAADIMDRNLYERANDCRWWALSPVLREQLAGEAPDAGVMAQVLDGINRLYTVYSRLVVFDAAGTIRATSRGSEGDGLPGSAVPAPWLEAVTRLADVQRYAVSPFEDTPLHDQGPTYVYLAAVRHPADERRVVGGIAIVFNAATELAAMLRDVMAERAGFAAFVDAQGQVLAANDGALAAQMAQQLAGRASALLAHEGTHYAVATVRAGGYREFKSSDGYDNGVRALIGLRLGTSERRQRQLSERDLVNPGRAEAGRAQLEAAVFQVGAGRYALPSSQVMEAIAPKGLVHTPGTVGAAVGIIEVPAPGGSRLVPAICARRLFGLNYPARAGDGVLLVVRSALDEQRPAFALRVDDVLTVLDLARDRIHPAPEGFRQFAPWVSEIAECEAVGPEGSEPVLVQLLDSRLVGGSAAEPAVESLADAEALLLAEVA